MDALPKLSLRFSVCYHMRLSMHFKRTICVTTVLCSLLLCTHAFADACSNLDGNAQWNEGMTTLSAQLTAKQWNEALKTAENLNTICERSPMLNYAMGRIYREKGNDSKSLYYYQRATLYTEEFAVKGKTLELMWFDRYEAEHPEARPDVIASRIRKSSSLRHRHCSRTKKTSCARPTNNTAH